MVSLNLVHLFASRENAANSTSLFFLLNVPSMVLSWKSSWESSPLFPPKPESISTIKNIHRGLVLTPAAANLVWNQKVFAWPSKQRVCVHENVYECVYCCRPWVSFHGGGWGVWKAVNVSECHVRLNWFLDKVGINTCPRTIGESCGAWLKKWGCVFFLSRVLKRGRWRVGVFIFFIAIWSWQAAAATTKTSKNTHT